MIRGRIIFAAAAVFVLIAIIVLWRSDLGKRYMRSGPAGTAASTAGREAAPVQGGGPQSAETARSSSSTEPAAEVPTVEIPLDRQQMLGVRTVEASLRNLDRVIRTVGRVEYDERRIATANVKFEGWIEKLHVDYTGKYVKKGDALAEIYSPELLATQQEYLNAVRLATRKRSSADEKVGEMLVSDGQSLREAAAQRLRLWDISDEQIRKIEESGKTIRTLTLYSPAGGYVVQKMAVQGMRVMPGEKLFDIADLSSVWVLSDIYENELAMVKAGETARITLSYFPGKEYSSRIDYVYPSLSGDTRTAKVRFSIQNPGGLLKPQMYTNVEVRIGLGKRLAIPVEAVLDTGVRQIVYVDKGEGYFEPREVVLGVQAEGWREVKKGLKAGEKVASAATFLIDSEAQLKGVVPLSGQKH